MAADKFTVPSFRAAKADKRPISMLTAYDYTTACLLDEAGVDSILVGDSLGMVMLGYENTLRVTMDEMIHHTRAVARGTRKALLIGDMPFLSYHVSVEEAVRNAGRFVQEGRAEAVKLEGGPDCDREGARHREGADSGTGPSGPDAAVGQCFRWIQGPGQGPVEAARNLVDDALLLQDAGVSASCWRSVPDTLARMITSKLGSPPSASAPAPTATARCW
jgi:3-methyl-2-oxobutanoate hydroxymethyltransferase